jgi:hypothetical protein
VNKISVNILVYYNFFPGNNCPRTISILSNGGGAESWKDQLGCYNLVRYDDTGNAVYKHDLENGNFLFKTKANDKMWMVNLKILSYPSVIYFM